MTMPVKLTAKQEAFALGVVEGKTQADAYREAYPGSRNWKPETVWARASELMADGKVSGRVNELREQIAERHHVTQDELVAMARKAYDLAERREESSAMTQATLAIAKITGHLDRKPEMGERVIRLEYITPTDSEAVDGEFEEMD
jgi:hypothetical protein